MTVSGKLELPGLRSQAELGNERKASDLPISEIRRFPICRTNWPYFIIC